METLTWTAFKALIDSISPPLYSAKEDSSFINLFIVLESVLFSCNIDKTSGDYTDFESSYRSKLNLNGTWDISAKQVVVQAPLSGPSTHGVLSVGTGTAVEAKVGVSSFTNRKVVSLQPAGRIFVYFANEAETPTLSDIQNKGFEHYKDALQTYDAGPNQKLFLLSASGTVNVRIAERS